MKPIVLLLGLVITGALADDTDNVVDLDGTIKEVENILAEDPKLPRLTRGEIVSLIDEVRRGKDLMVVLPQQYNATLEEMFTAKPVTQIIQDDGQLRTTKRPKRRRKPVRPVYEHTTAASSTTESQQIFSSNAETTITTVTTTEIPETKKSTTTERWIPKIYITPNTVTTVGTTETPSTEIIQTKPDVSAAAESLSPDMKELLSSFGLLAGPSTTTTEQPTFMIKSITPSVDPSSYSRFKPLPSGFDGMSSDMKSFLASYGLLDIRKGKAITSTVDPFEHLPHKDILEDLGLRKSRKLIHVFNPNSVKNSTEELDKVNKILMKLREYSEGNGTELSEEEVNELLLLENNTRLTAGEEPYDELQSLKNKIEIKRQQPNDTDFTTTTPEPAERTTISEGSVNEETPASTERTPSASDLADSFGSTDTSTRRPNGFYFLLDWNSFLDVTGETRNVNLNFSPKVGDPRNFLPVTIP